MSAGPDLGPTVGDSEWPMDQTSSVFPTEVLTEILQHVPQNPRFSICALVCRAWHSAAVAGTSCITAELEQQAQLASIGLWLQRQGANLEALSITSAQTDICACDIFLSFQQLQHLTSLALKHVDLINECVKLLPQLTSLRQLQLSWLNFHSSLNTHTDVPFSKSLQCALEGCTQLTSLMIDGHRSCSDSMFGSLGNLTQLQQLQVTGPDLSAGTLFKSLPLSLTHLKFHAYHLRLDPSTTPRISQLTCLTHLTVSGIVEDHYTTVDFDPQLLQNLLQLQHLELTGCTVTTKEDVDVLLAVLQQLKQLQHLCLCWSLDKVTDIGQYTALVVSTQLTLLDLTECIMPYNAVYHMFAEELQYTALQAFGIGCNDVDPYDERQEVGPTIMQWTVCDRALERLVSSCPGLRELQLFDTIQPGCAALTVLEGLTALSKLKITRGIVSNDSIGALVELELPALRNLAIFAGHSLTDHRSKPRLTAEGALCLSQMTQLTRLYLRYSVVDDNSSDGKVSYERISFVNKDGLSDLRQRMIRNFTPGSLKLGVMEAEVLPLEQLQDPAEGLQIAEAAEQ